MQLHCTPPQGCVPLQGSNLILATEGVGNVGQLACDLLISTFQAQRVAWLDDDALLPAVGSTGGTAGSLAFGLELYQVPEGSSSSSCSGKRTFILQQRAPVAPGLQRTFGERLATWLRETGVAEVLVLGSLDAAFRRDAQLQGMQLRSWCQDAQLAERCSSCGLPALEESWFADRALQEQLLPPWPLLVQLQQQEEGAPRAAAALIFAAEGDNVGDAHALAGAVAQLAGLAQGQPRWAPPPSWQYVFGRALAVY